MAGRDTVNELRKLMVRENVKQPVIEKILKFYIQSIKDEAYQKQHVKISEEGVDEYIYQIIDMFRKNEYTEELAASYIKFVFEKIYRGISK